MVTILNYDKSIIYHTIYINVFSDGTVSYPMISTDNILNTTNIKTAFTKIIIVLEEAFHNKVQEVYVLRYLNLRIFQYLLGFSIHNTNSIRSLINEWFPTEKLRKVYTPFITDTTYEK